MLSWYFSIDNTIHKLSLKEEHLTNRRVLILDTVKIYDTGELGLFNKSDLNLNFKISEIVVWIYEEKDVIILEIGGHKFSDLLLAELNQKKQKAELQEQINIQNSQQFFGKIDHSKSPLGVIVPSLEEEEEILRNAKTPFDD